VSDHDKDFKTRTHSPLPDYTVTEKLAAVLLETQFDGLKVLKSENVAAFKRHCEQRDYRNRRRQSTEFIIDDVLDEAKPLDDRQLNGFVQEVTTGLTDQSKKFKLTIKKNYVNEILLQAKGAQNLAQYVVMIVCNEN